MFTGLIEATGTVHALASQAGGAVLELHTALGPELALGDSLSTNGVCLTVTRRDGPHVAMDVSPETLRVTALGRLTPGRPVNLERPLRVDARLGGHVVQGHVDGVGALVSIADEGEFRRAARGFSGRAGALDDPQGLDCRGRHQPDHRRARRRVVRRPGDAAHLGAHDPVGCQGRRRPEPRVRPCGKIRRPPGDARTPGTAPAEPYENQVTVAEAGIPSKSGPAARSWPQRSRCQRRRGRGPSVARRSRRSTTRWRRSAPAG